MRTITLTMLIACLAIGSLKSPLKAEIATLDEAQTVANNWINLIIQKKGNWGGVKTAEAEKIQEFKRGDRLLGYFCHVKPKGNIVVSLRKELSPVKAYSTSSDLDPLSDEGVVDIIKLGMERILNTIEKKIGSINSARKDEVTKILEFDYCRTWDKLLTNDKQFKLNLESDLSFTDYRGGDPPLLSSNWHQNEPYNDQCPDMGCNRSCNTNTNAIVGCVATAGAQIMRYWNWPPKDIDGKSYDWANMPDGFTGCNFPQIQVNAVAELCAEIGRINDTTTYGCSSTSGNTPDMLRVYEWHFRYAYPWRENRWDYSTSEWFDLMKSEFNKNRPVHYHIPGHSLVADGWDDWGDPFFYMCHFNYGWTDVGQNFWYCMDPDIMDIPHGDHTVEYMLISIIPDNRIGTLRTNSSYKVTDTSFPYCYFDLDATGFSVTFESGHKIQFLPKVTVTGTYNDPIRFEGSHSDNTLLFTRGDQSKGILIHDGAIALYKNGSLTFP